MKTHTVYLSGPMTGIADFNYPAFHARATALEKLGHEVINPAATAEADTAHLEKVEWHDYLAADISRMRHATAILFLEGWEKATARELKPLLLKK